MTTLNFEACSRAHLLASPERQEAGLRAWWTALTGEAQQATALRRLPLKEVAAEIGRHPTLLWRLGVVDNCGQQYGGGGRKVYTVAEVLDYLRSPACARRRAELQAKRRADGTGTRTNSNPKSSSRHAA